VQIAILGPLEIRMDSGEPRAISGPRLARLVIALALNPGRVVPTSSLVDAVWDDEPPDEAANAVQALVSRLRRSVPGITVASRAQGYVLDVAPEAIDVRQFENLIADGRRESSSNPSEAAAKLRDALALWRGPALADAGDADFARAARARLDELRLDALQERIDVDLRNGAAPGLIAELEGLVVAYPLREAFVKLLMRALAAAGDRGRALAVFDAARRRLSDELGVAPSADLAAEHVRILRTDAAPTDEKQTEEERPAPTTKAAAVPTEAPAPPTNLRAEISTFVGREHDIATLNELVHEHRLVTLTGPGGAGKTRLATHVARQHLGAQPDGIWMFELAPVGDPSDVVPSVLAVLGVRDRALVRGAATIGLGESAADPVERLVSSLRDRHALLVFDNCEHVIGAAAELVGAILGACPEVRIVATSREPLGLTGEALWPVEPLTVPPADPVPPAAELTNYSAVRLLAQRAAAVRPGFAVTDDNAAVVARIVRALDGMPLAIELAAARLRAMTVEQLAARLDDRFALLTAGSRTALPRHQTLRAVVDWSWDLLSEPEQILWRRLSIFTGGATLAGAERMCADGALGAASALDVLTALVDRSLLVVREDGPEPRYVMLETIRAYGQMRLEESGEEPLALTAHAAHFSDLADRARDELLRADQLEWLARLTADHDNLYAAVRNATAAGDARTATRLVGSLGWYWWLRGHRTEGVEVVKGALAIAERPSEGDVREELATAYTVGALLSADGTREMSLALEWLDAASALIAGDVPATPLLRMLGPLHAMLDTFRSEGLSGDHEIAMPVDDPDPWIAATALIIRAHVRLNFGRDHDRAVEDFARALDTYRQLGERWGIAFSLLSLGTLAAWRGEIEAAIGNLTDAIRRVTELGVWEDRLTFRSQLVRLLWVANDHDAAMAALAQAELEGQRVGTPEAQGVYAWTAADVARWDGDLVRAAHHVRRAEELAAS